MHGHTFRLEPRYKLDMKPLVPALKPVRELC
jgi:hypothetical protein